MKNWSDALDELSTIGFVIVTIASAWCVFVAVIVIGAINLLIRHLF